LIVMPQSNNRAAASFESKACFKTWTQGHALWATEIPANCRNQCLDYAKRLLNVLMTTTIN